MPLVARSIQILGGIIAVSPVKWLLLVMLAATPGTSSLCIAQQPEPSTTPAPVPSADSARAVAATQAEPVQESCIQEVLKQQKLTRTIRELRNPLPHPDDAAARELKRAYLGLLSRGFSGENDTKVVQDYLSAVIFRATDPDFVVNPKNMQTLLDDIEDDVARAGLGEGNPSNQEKIRQKFCGEVLKLSKQMLDNNLDSRLAAVNILRMLYDIAPVQSGRKAKLHAEALTTLLAVMADQEQPDSVKVAVANALRNVLRNCDIGALEQFQLCDALGNQLGRPCCEAAYQRVLIDALLDLTVARRTVGQAAPTAQLHFAAVVNDRSRPIEVRCHAALGIGRGAFDPQMKFDPLAWKIAQLAGDASVQFNRSSGDPKWPVCGADLLFAFRHIDKSETSGADRKGLLNRDPKSLVISEAAALVTPVAVQLVENSKTFSLEQLKPLAMWIQENQPSSLKWDDNAPPLTP